ncbi:MAG: hypothetical protein PF961_07735 [Planctomycetota bacterium]|jgi:hypothetical protein|nr:hypothetical protein [Planctomycetota bacterium]
MASFATAQKFVLHFGAFKDMSIDDIAGTDSGLLYLDNLFAIMEKKHAGGELWPREAFLHDCLQAFLSDPGIAKDLDALAGERFAPIDGGGRSGRLS